MTSENHIHRSKPNSNKCIKCGELIHNMHEPKKMTPRTKATVLAILSVIVVFIIIGIVGSSGPGTSSSDNNMDTETTASTSAISESDAEKFCQDENLTPILSGNAEYSDVSVIDVWNYNTNYMDTGDYDKNGNPIMILTWNGKRGDSTLSFSCYVSGTKESPELHYLSMSGEVMRGDPEYQTYTKNGEAR